MALSSPRVPSDSSKNHLFGIHDPVIYRWKSDHVVQIRPAPVTSYEYNMDINISMETTPLELVISSSPPELNWDHNAHRQRVVKTSNGYG